MEYQHFIPQFILRNYAQPYECPQLDCKGKKKKSRHRHEKGKYPGDLVVNHANLTSEPYVLDQGPVNRMFGLPDMYMDWGKAVTSDHRRIESMLGLMESKASTVFRKIVKAYEAGDAFVTLARPERNLVRKFVFLLKYRGSTFHLRFYHQDADSYFANDREFLYEYMLKHGFATPMDVWFHNLEKIVNVEMDSELKWIQELPKQMYPDDAGWFIHHTQETYMAICRPSRLDEEFILTDNCYNVFEGPNTYVQDARTGKCVEASYGNFHDFAPISPKLIIVLRTRLLPIPLEDQNPELKQRREDGLWSAFGESYQFGARSMLEDLPIQLPRNGYTEWLEGRAYTTDNGIRTDRDKFFFDFFSIRSKHVRTINGIFLDNAYRGKSIAFGSRPAFCRTLDWFMGEPCKVGKIITGIDASERLKHVKGLEKLAKSLGSTKPALFKVLPNPVIDDSVRFENRHAEFRRMMQGDGTASQNSEQDRLDKFFEGFCKLETFSHDMAQSGKMRYLEKMLTIWSLRVEAQTRRRNRQLLRTAYLDLSPSRVWLYVKRIRLESLGNNDGIAPIQEFVLREDLRNGPEDAFIAARNLMSPSVLNRNMYITVTNDLKKRMLPFVSWWPQGGFDPMNLLRLKMFYDHVLVAPGIKIIEKLATVSELLLLRDGTHLQPTAADSHLEEDDKLELWTRIQVRSRFAGVMRGKMTTREIADLETVFFDLTFPTPPASVA
ncbi:hypothetical protein HJFPF1_02475 [Paramyrothecium foliicola]|nr:hypothetical protein HJFPF1_02475 [Paramyrothecium foliicola]